MAILPENQISNKLTRTWVDFTRGVVFAPSMPWCQIGQNQIDGFFGSSGWRATDIVGSMPSMLPIEVRVAQNCSLF